MDKKEAYKIVLEDLKKVSAFRGLYNTRRAKHGKYVMMGIEWVMDAIAAEISEEEYDKFDTEFVDNLIESERKAHEN